jgi:hypothetical protein
MAESSGWSVVVGLVAAIAAGFSAYQSYIGVRLTGEIQSQIATGQQNSDLLKKALDIVSDPRTKGDRALRKWAREIISKLSPVELTAALTEKIESGELTLTSGTTKPIVISLPSQVDDCLDNNGEYELGCQFAYKTPKATYLDPRLQNFGINIH